LEDWHKKRKKRGFCKNFVTVTMTEEEELVINSKKLVL
jgi:hypothetical protein